MQQFIEGKVDEVRVAYMNFVSAGDPEGRSDAVAAAGGAGSCVERPPRKSRADKPKIQTVYEFSPDPKTLLDELLPLTVKTALFQAFMDATTSENVARMVAMKSATDNADEMVKTLTMQYNRARQSQITTELAEIMGGVEAMKN